MTDYRKPSKRMSRYLCISQVACKVKDGLTEQEYVRAVLDSVGVSIEYLVSIYFAEGAKGPLALSHNNKVFTFEFFDLNGEIPFEAFHQVRNVVLRNLRGSRNFTGDFYFVGYIDI